MKNDTYNTTATKKQKHAIKFRKINKRKNIVKFHTYITVRIRFSMVLARPYVRRPSEAARGIFGSRVGR